MTGGRPDDVDVRGCVNELLMSMHRRDVAELRRRRQLARTLDVSDVDATALSLLGHEKELTTAQLGNLLGLSSGGATALVQRLERLRLVRRRAHPRDRRSSLLRLHGSAAAAIARLDEPLVQDLARELRSLDPEHRTEAIALVQRLVDLCGSPLADPADQRQGVRAAKLARPVPSRWS